MTTAIFEIPFPPSVNTYWGFKGHRRYLTSKANNFKTQVAQIVSQQSVKFTDELLVINIVWHCPDKRIRDIDNPIKPLLDSLVQANLMQDDSQIRKLTVEFGEVIKGGKAVVKISSL